MLQQMAAESTGTAAPIHLQGEPMATNTADKLVGATPGHAVNISSQSDDNGMRYWAECECDWSGPVQHSTAGGQPGYMAVLAAARADGLAHAAQFKAPEPEPEPEHRTIVELVAGEHSSNYRAKCNCGWYSHRYGGDKPGHGGATKAADEHEAMFKAPEPTTITNPAEQGQAFTDYVRRTFAANANPLATVASTEHLQAYAAKRAEWLQAKHDADVAQKAHAAAEAKFRSARDLTNAAFAHLGDCGAAVDNLEAELLALVKGEQA